MTSRELVAHIQDMEGRAHRLATENADLRDENRAMLNALVKCELAFKEYDLDFNWQNQSAISEARRAVTAFVGNVETETLTDKNADHV